MIFAVTHCWQLGEHLFLHTYQRLRQCDRKCWAASCQCDLKKSPNVYKVCQKMISLEIWYILTPLQKLPKNVGDLGKLIVAKGFKSCPKPNKLPDLVTLVSDHLAIQPIIVYYSINILTIKDCNTLFHSLALRARAAGDKKNVSESLWPSWFKFPPG